MPLYDYQCDRCGGFRQFHPMSQSAAAQPCPGCNAPCERHLSAPFLAGGAPLGRPAQPQAANGRVPWRKLCGIGCNHAHC